MKNLIKFVVLALVLLVSGLAYSQNVIEGYLLTNVKDVVKVEIYTDYGYGEELQEVLAFKGGRKYSLSVNPNRDYRLVFKSKLEGVTITLLVKNLKNKIEYAYVDIDFYITGGGVLSSNRVSRNKNLCEKP